MSTVCLPECDDLNDEEVSLSLPPMTSSFGLTAARRREAFLDHLAPPVSGVGQPVTLRAEVAPRVGRGPTDVTAGAIRRERVYPIPVFAPRTRERARSLWSVARERVKRTRAGAGAAVLALRSGTIPGLSYDELVRRYLELERVSRTDSLTGIPNRSYIDEQLGVHLSASRRHGQFLSLIILDLDDFKRINDCFGHLAGDAALREFTRRLNGSLRAEDVAGRWGGEEFLVILPSTDAAGALLLAERIRANISALPMMIGDERVVLTVSGGVATASDESADELVRKADEALYRAKHSGRNRIAPQGVRSLWD